MASILGSVVCTPTIARAGDSILVEVYPPRGLAYNNTEMVPIAINGVCGSSQYLVWTTPGTHRVVVTAHPPGGNVEQVITTVQITPAAAGPSPPFLRIRMLPDQPYRARLSIVRLDTGVPPIGGAGVRVRPRVVAPMAPRTVPHRGIPNIATVTHVNAAATAANHTVTASGAQIEQLYIWEFSDGIKQHSGQPTTDRDFAAKLDLNRPYEVFHVSVTMQDPSSGPIVIRRSVSIANPYYPMKRKGILQPPVISSDLNLYFTQGAWRATFSVRNPEADHVVLTSRMLVYTFDPATGRPDEHGPSEQVSILLGANSTTALEIALSSQDVPSEAIAIHLRYVGVFHGQPTVRVSVTFDIPQQASGWQYLSPVQEQQLIGVIAKVGSENPKSIRGSDIREMVRSGALLDREVSALKSPPRPPPPPPDHEPPPAAKEGEECDPWNLPDVVPSGMFCMPTAETRYVLMPPRFMNARKGDVVITPGDGGLIASTLAAVSPPQHYSHSGMMTRNLDEITHSTASPERMTDSTYVGSGGFRADILKYLWPGVITQTVGDAVNCEWMTDPETGTQYLVGGFGALQADQNDLDGTGASIAVALVIKPDPLTETPAIRSQLSGFADFAAAQEHKSHYRFFCFTDPTIALNTAAPNEAKWAAGTFPSVCSAFVWKSIRQSGVQIEGGLEPVDISAGAQIAVGTPDGLYVYQADERLAAGEILYDRVGDLARQAAGQFWAGITDIEEDLGNQVVNTFATDWSDTDATESDIWRQTVDANAVSPQNLLFYDAPLYGYSEPLIFRDQRFEEVTIYKWTLVLQTGTLTGLTRFQGQPLAGADVQITVAQLAHSDAQGKFTLTTVPTGEVIVTAQKVQNNERLSAQAVVKIIGGQTANVTLNLQPPSDLFRRIVIDGNIMTTDYEFAAAANPRNNSNFNGIADLDPTTATHAVKTFDCIADNDTLGRLILTFDLQTDGSVSVKSTIRCYDLSTDDTDDYDEGSLPPFTLSPGHSSHWDIHVDGENRADAYFQVQNVTNPS